MMIKKYVFGNPYETGATVLPVEPVGGRFVIPATAAKRTLVLSFEGDGHVDFAKMRRASGFVLIVQ